MKTILALSILLVGWPLVAEAQNTKEPVYSYEDSDRRQFRFKTFEDFERESDKHILMDDGRTGTMNPDGFIIMDDGTTGTVGW